MDTRRRTAVAGFVGSLAVLLGVPVAWSVSAPADVVGSRAAVNVAEPVDESDVEPDAEPGAAVGATPGLWPVAPEVATPVPAPAPPVEVDIADAGILAGIDPVGVGQDGSMVIPTNADRVGWYQYGPAPGAAGGSAVLAGHVDSRRQGRGAMFALRWVEVGAPVRIRLADGVVVSYRVIARELLAKRDLPVADLFSGDGPPRLTLITCGGEYDGSSGGYRDNVVVTAVPDPAVEPDRVTDHAAGETDGIA